MDEFLKNPKNLGIIIGTVVTSALLAGGGVYFYQNKIMRILQDKVVQLDNQTVQDIADNSKDRLNYFYKQTADLGNSFDSLAKAVFIFKDTFTKDDPTEIIQQALSRLDEVSIRTTDYLN